MVVLGSYFISPGKADSVNASFWRSVALRRNGSQRLATRLARLVTLSLLVSFLSTFAAEAQVTYPIVSVRAPRYGDAVQTTWQEVDYPAAIEPGQDLVILYPDGREETLVDCRSGRRCSVVDPAISFDGNSVYYSLYPDVSAQGMNSQMGLSREGADIFKMDLRTRETTQLTHGEFTPNTGVVNWSASPIGASGYRLGYGIMNLGPYPVPGPDGAEWIVFFSNRNGFVPPRGFTKPTYQLFLMDERGRNVRLIGHLNLGSALHPTTLTDGRVMFSSLESQGTRDNRAWGLWAVLPDGRAFEPLMSALFDGGEAEAFHFQSQLSNSDITVAAYYNLNNNGFGTIYGFSSQRLPNQANFGSPDPNDPSNPPLRSGIWFFQPGHPSHLQPRYLTFPFSPLGLRNLTAFTHHEDTAASRTPSGGFAGKTTHPSGAPNNDLLMIYSPGPVNDLPRPTTVPRVMGGIYLLRAGVAVDSPSAMVPLKVDPNFNYQQPRAVASYRQIYGIPGPTYVPYLPDGDTPFGEVGTASLYNRNTAPGVGVASYNGLDPFNTNHNSVSSNWVQQGADAGLYSNSDIWAIRILAMEPTSHLAYGPDGLSHTGAGFESSANERLRILGEIPVRKFDASGQQPVDGDGNPDTSFRARIPADVPFTFQTLDRNGMVLNMAQTWHQVRPGELRTDCGGCHAHANTPTDFSRTAAARPDYQVRDLTRQLMLLTKDASGNPQTASYTGESRKHKMDVEYNRDIKPILQRSCAGCHSGSSPAAGLNLGGVPVEDGQYDQAYQCLARDASANCGPKPVISSKTWRGTNLSRYVRAFQSRRSLLIWKVFGRRLDGWQNSDHPTESVAGDASTLPAGADPNEADLDYTGTIMPPPGSGYPALSEEDKMTLARWIDLGVPTARPDGREAQAGWFTDELRPTLNISWPRAGESVAGALNRIEFVADDYYSGLNSNSLKVTANFPINGNAPGQNIASAFSSNGQGKWTMPLSIGPDAMSSGTITVEIADLAGNIARQESTFRLRAAIEPPPPVLNPPLTSPPGNPGSDAPPSAVELRTSADSFVVRLPNKRARPSVKTTMTAVVRNLSLSNKSKIVFSSSLTPAAKMTSRSRTSFKLTPGKAKTLKVKMRFTRAGTYSVSFRVSYPGGSAERHSTVTVLPPDAGKRLR